MGRRLEKRKEAPMSRTLNFVHHLLDMGRNLQRLGQTRAASRLLGRLSSFRELPNDLAEEAQLRLGELHLQCGQFKKARRRLAAALLIQPDSARSHYLMAGAIEDDEECNVAEALTHYRRCAKLDPDNAEYFCAWGLLALDLRETEEGLEALRRAAELAPDDPDVLRQVLEGLREAGEIDEAAKLLQTALFHNPRDQRLRELRSHHQFQLLRAEQQVAARDRLPAEHTPPILPFTRPEPDNDRQPAVRKRIRHDLPSGTPGPKLPVRGRMPHRKKA
jgi:tetratricopeptide (TPR) repeat protein